MAQTTEIEKLERRHAEHPEGRTFAPLANAYRKRGEVTRALELLGAGLERHPGYIGAQIVLGLCHADLGADTEAATAFESVLLTDPENVIALKALADVAERAGHFDRARSRLAFLLEIDRGNAEARQQLERLEGLDDAPVAAAEPVEDPASPAGEVESLIVDEADVEELDPSDDSPAGLELTNSFSSEAIEPEEAAPAEVDLVRTEGLEPGEFEGAAEVAPLEGLDPPTESPFDGMVIERESDIELEAHERNEFQMADAAGELQAAIGEEDDADDWASLEPLEAPIEPAGLDADPPEIALDDDFDDAAAGMLDPVLPGSADEDLVVMEESPDSTGEDLLDDEPASPAGLPPGAALASDLMALDRSEARGREDIATDLEDDAGPRFDPDPEPIESPEPGTSGTAFLMDDELVPAATGHDLEAEPDEIVEPPGMPGSVEPGATIAPTDEPSAWETADEASGADFPSSPAVPAVVTVPHDDPEPELVVTETMAEIYERQGLHEDALRVYRALAERRPRDESLVTRIQRLESRVREQAAAAAPPPAAPSRPDWSGGDGAGNAGSFFRSVLGAGLAPEAPAPARPHHRGGEHASGDAAPTRPAADPVSLGAVFGEEMPPSAPASSQASGSASGNGFSFDAFFGAGGGSREQAQGGAKGSGEQEDLAQFHAWLQSLKG